MAKIREYFEGPLASDSQSLLNDIQKLWIEICEEEKCSWIPTISVKHKFIPTICRYNLISSTMPQEGKKRFEKITSILYFSDVKKIKKEKDIFLYIVIDKVDNKSVTHLQIEGTLVELNLCNAISNLMINFQSLKFLRLTFCNLRTEGILWLACSLIEASTILDISLDGNPNNEENFYIILQKNPRIENISLRFCNIGAEGCKKLSKTIINDQQINLKYLNLDSNRIDDNAAKWIGDILRWNRTIIALSLAGNIIQDNGAAFLSVSLGVFQLREAEVEWKYNKILQKYEKYRKTVEEGMEAFLKNLEIPPRPKSPNFDELSSTNLNEVDITRSIPIKKKGMKSNKNIDKRAVSDNNEKLLIADNHLNNKINETDSTESELTLSDKSDEKNIINKRMKKLKNSKKLISAKPTVKNIECNRNRYFEILWREIKKVVDAFLIELIDMDNRSKTKLRCSLLYHCMEYFLKHVDENFDKFVDTKDPVITFEKTEELWHYINDDVKFRMKQKNESKAKNMDNIILEEIIRDILMKIVNDIETKKGFKTENYSKEFENLLLIGYDYVISTISSSKMWKWVLTMCGTKMKLKNEDSKKFNKDIISFDSCEDNIREEVDKSMMNDCYSEDVNLVEYILDDNHKLQRVNEKTDNNIYVNKSKIELIESSDSIKDDENWCSDINYDQEEIRKNSIFCQNIDYDKPMSKTLKQLKKLNVLNIENKNENITENFPNENSSLKIELINTDVIKDIDKDANELIDEDSNEDGMMKDEKLIIDSDENINYVDHRVFQKKIIEEVQSNLDSSEWEILKNREKDSSNDIPIFSNVLNIMEQMKNIRKSKYSNKWRDAMNEIYLENYKNEKLKEWSLDILNKMPIESHPIINEVFEDDGYLWCSGNNKLGYLNLAYNDLGSKTAASFLKRVLYQDSLGYNTASKKGLKVLMLEGTRIDSNNPVNKYLNYKLMSPKEFGELGKKKQTLETESDESNLSLINLIGRRNTNISQSSYLKRKLKNKKNSAIK